MSGLVLSVPGAHKHFGPADRTTVQELARLLGHERRLLELLLLEARLLPYAVSEVERARRRVQEAELLRSILVADVARDLDVPADALTMRALADNSVEPYRTIFADHRRAFLDLAAEIEDIRQSGYQATLGATSMPSLADFLR